MKALLNNRTAPAPCSETVKIVVQYKLPVGAQWSFDRWIDMATFDDGSSKSAEQYVERRRGITPDFRFQVVRRTTIDVVVTPNTSVCGSPLGASTQDGVVGTVTELKHKGE